MSPLVQENRFHRNTLEHVVRQGLKLLPEKLLVVGNGALEQQLPVLVHESHHVVAEHFVAIEQIIELVHYALRFESDFVVSDVDVGLPVFGFCEVIAGDFMPRCHALHGDICSAFTRDRQVKDLPGHLVVAGKVKSIGVDFRFELELIELDLDSLHLGRR